MENDFVLTPRFSLDAVPNLFEYFGLWSMEEKSFSDLVDRTNGLNLLEHVVSAAARDAVAKQNAADFQRTDDGIAQININGPMMKTVSSLSMGTSTVRVRQQLRAASKDPDIVGAILKMDTPGGTVRGNFDLAQEVANFAATKPIYAFVEDMTASAGVSVASQATKRYANSPQALYGSMGTYSVLVDQSGVANKVGVKVHVIKAGEFKGMGEPGTAITEDQLKEAQRIVNALNEGYLQLISAGLNLPLEKIRSLADGRAHTATAAQGLGLIDGVQSYERTYSELLSAVKKPISRSPSLPRSTAPMSDKILATLTELKAAFPHSTAEWRETQLEASASMQEAAIAYGKHVEAKAKLDAEAHAKELAEVKAKAEEDAKAAAGKKSGSLGHDPLRDKRRPTKASDETEYAGETGDPVEDFNAAVAKFGGAHPDRKKRQAAIRTVANRNPELYQAYLLATNPGARQQRMIKEKLESSISQN